MAMNGEPLTKYIESFFRHLTDDLGLSPHTIRSYSNAIGSLLDFFKEEKNMLANRIELSALNRNTVIEYLNWLQRKRGNSDRTRNHRLAAISSFAKVMMYEDIAHINQWSEILTIKQKKTDTPHFNYLSVEGMRHLLVAIPTDTRDGRRDLTMLLMLYETAARVQELVNLTPHDLVFQKACKVRLFGKGRKSRTVIIRENVADMVKDYMMELHLDHPDRQYEPLFKSRRGTRISCSGVAYVISQYANQCNRETPGVLPNKISPHSFRHSKAMHLLADGVNLIYIRDMLGHTSIRTTEIYARADSKHRNEAIENAYTDVLPVSKEKPIWNQDEEIRAWLRNLGK